ncbi:hypothetical protein CBS101457_004480 [Exobasidium rhododendri]|nr:hypothetical protein CBS101457_004480 [Exobasidium rhododendri]
MRASRRPSHRESSTSISTSHKVGDGSIVQANEVSRPPIPLPVVPASLAIDLGSYSIRICIARQGSTTPIVTRCPNAIVRSSQKRQAGAKNGPFAGPQIRHNCTNFGSLSVRQPMDRGMIVDWPTQKTILDLALLDALSAEKGAPRGDQRLLEGRDVIITEAYLNLPDLQASLDLLMLEEYGAARVWRCNPALLIPYHVNLFSNTPVAPPVKKRQRPECLCIVDLGHHATHVVPVLGDSIVWSSVRRHIISQRILTNLLKETLSFRQWDMMDESWLVGHIKEQCCFVATSAGRRGDLIHVNIDPPSKWSYAGLVELCSSLPPQDNPIVQEYVLPDYSLSTPARGKLGYIKGERGGRAAKDLDTFIRDSSDARSIRAGLAVGKGAGSDGADIDEDGSDGDFNDVARTDDFDETEQVLSLERERFQVPEVMFDPGIIGLDDAPLHRVIEASIRSCEETLQGPLWANIVLVGGGAKMRGLKERLHSELRPLAPADGPLHIWSAEDPSLSAILGAQSLLVDAQRILKARYLSAEEYSAQNSREIFGSWSGISPSTLTK